MVTVSIIIVKIIIIFVEITTIITVIIIIIIDKIIIITILIRWTTELDNWSRKEDVSTNSSNTATFFELEHHRK